MKFTKTLLATAVALSAVAASAQTANVTIYGSVRAAIELARYKGPTSSIRITSLDNVSSRFGLRGSESLGGGMNAIFQLESPIGLDDGTGGIAGREAWVGLQGGFGTVKLGYGLTAYDDVLGWAHHQGSNSWENRNNGLSGGAGFAKQDLFTNYRSTANCNSSAFDGRYGNSISYESPNFSGFSVRTSYGFLGEAAKDSCTGFDTALKYSNGPVRVGLAYANHRNFTGIGGSTTTPTHTGLITVKHNQDAIRGYGSFDAGVVKIDATYEQARYKPAGVTLKYKYWEIGALAPLGASTFGVQYSSRDKGLAALYDVGDRRLEVGGSNAAVAVSAGTLPLILAAWDRGGGKHLSFTHDYALSKRTTIRSYYTQLQNEATAVGTLPNVTFAGKTKISVISSGLWHSF
jgi:predicted porin